MIITLKKHNVGFKRSESVMMLIRIGGDLGELAYITYNYTWR